MLLLDPLGKGFGVRRFAFEQRDGFGESPFQVRVADLRARRFILLARRTVRAFDQPSVRQKVADLRKAADVVDLVQHRHRQDSANAGNAHQAVERIRIVNLRVLFQVEIEPLDLFVIEVDQVHVERDHALHAVFLEAIGDADTIRLVADRLFEGRQVLLMVDHLYVDDRGGSASHDHGSPSQQVARASHVFGIDVAGREVPASQQHRQFLGVDAIALGLTAVNGFQVQCVAEQKREVLLMTQIGEPVPIESRLAADDEIVLLEGLQRDEELLGFLGIEVPMEVFVSLMVDDADVHRVGVQVDSAVESVLSIVELHIMSFLERVSLSHETFEAATR